MAEHKFNSDFFLFLQDIVKPWWGLSLGNQRNLIGNSAQYDVNETQGILPLGEGSIKYILDTYTCVSSTIVFGNGIGKLLFVCLSLNIFKMVDLDLCIIE